VRRFHCVLEEYCNFLVQELGYGQLLGGQEENNTLYRFGNYISEEINFTPRKFMQYYLLKRITCNFISHLPADDNWNMCVGVEIRKTQPERQNDGEE
jgi:hypothetical protein